MTQLLAYIPFLTPINWFQTTWPLLVLPLAFGVSMIYKAMRLEDLAGYWRSVTIMSVQIVLGMIGLGVALFILVQWVVPMLPAE